MIHRHQEGLLRLKRVILEDYSYRDLRAVDWEQRFAKFGQCLVSSRTARDFAQIAADLLSVARDIHLWLRVKNLTIPTYRRCVQRNIVGSLMPKIIPGWRQHNVVVMSGRFPKDILYLGLSAWPPDAPERLKPAYRIIHQAATSGRPLIIDVRANGGGAEPLAARLASCFIKQPVCYAKHLIRRRGSFKGPFERWLKPNKTGPHYQGRVAVLIGAGTVSSCESFTLMMRQVPGCVLIGQPTAGASGNPKPADLGNGVIAFVPSWQDLDLDGTGLEGHGVIPDIHVKTRKGDFMIQDPVLNAALKYLRTDPESICFT